MDRIFQFDVTDLFTLKASVLEILLRAFVLYTGLCLLLRVLPKRKVGHASVTDLVFVVIVGGVTVEAAATGSESLTDFLLMLGALMLISYCFDLFSFHYPWFRYLIQEPPTCIIRDGQILQENLRRELITLDELHRELRRQGIEDPESVDTAHLEADGEISVVTTAREEESPGSTPELGPERGELAVNDSDVDVGVYGEEDPDVAAFLRSAEKLRKRLVWHQEQLVRCKKILARYGVRIRSGNSDSQGQTD